MTQQPADNWTNHYRLSIAEAGHPSRTIILPGTVTIGRDAENDIVLAAASVSRQHALLLRDADGTLLIDLESTNGTLVNGVLTHPDQPVRLADGDTLGFGQVVARYGRTTSDE
jgi:putative peptide zinc metalloprotease protein